MFCKFYPGLILSSCLSLCLVVYGGCGSSPQSKLIGTWEMDMSGATAELSQKAGDNPAAQMAAQFAKSMGASSSITMEFRPDGKLIANVSMFGQAHKDEGEWKYEGMEGDEMIISIATKDKATKSAYVKFLPDGTMETRDKTMDGSPMTMKLKRVK